MRKSAGPQVDQKLIKKMMKDILSFVSLGKVATENRPTANSRHSEQTDGAASSSGGEAL